MTAECRHSVYLGCPDIQMSPNESCQTSECRRPGNVDILYIWAAQIWAAQLPKCHLTSRVRHQNVDVLSHVWTSHAEILPRMSPNESCHTYECVMSHIWVTRVTSPIWMSHVTHVGCKKFDGQLNVEQPENCPKRALWKRQYSAKETYDSRMSTFCISMISGLLEIIGLFCKRALWKRLYSAKGTYNSRIYSCPKIAPNNSCQMCEWVSHVTHMNESCHICEWVMSHIWMSQVAYVSESCHTYERSPNASCEVMYMSESCHMNESCQICECILSHVRTSQITYVSESCHPCTRPPPPRVSCQTMYMNESCHPHEWFVSPTWMSHVKYMSASCHTYEWVMSHIWMSQVAYVTESCHPYEWSPNKNE